MARREEDRRPVGDDDEGGWDWYRDEVDRAVGRARVIARVLQQLAIYLAVLELIGFLALVIAGLGSDDYERATIVVTAIIYLPIAVIIPAGVWAFGALLDVHALRLDVAILEAALEDEDED